MRRDRESVLWPAQAEALLHDQSSDRAQSPAFTG